ncbi:MAG: phospholipase, partial [Proteiniphilum sp.]|nr:phospholipase [Proteiniphilum sp.]
MKYKNFKISFLILFTVVMTATAQYKEYDSLAYVSRSGGDTLLYRQLNPLQVEDGKKYPLVLFLHGAGERGADNRAQLT